MNRLILALLFLLCGIGAHAQRLLRDVNKLRDCDLLFVVAPIANAITEVTKGRHSLPIDHVAIFFWKDSQPMVIEANYKGVVQRPLNEFLHESSMILVGRVKGDLDKPASLQRAHEFLGRPYDYVYLPGNEAIYCSELVQLSYAGHDGKLFFPPIPMSFHDDDGVITPFWSDFYSRRALDVPEGVSGTNPGELSRRKCVRIKYKMTPFAK